jgi:hypothetical protein
MKIIFNVIFLFLLFISSALYAQDAENKNPSTFCNPMDLDYGWGNFKLEKMGRHAADPVIVLFKNKYYLFSTLDIGGYRISDDLIHWRDIYFEKEIYDSALEIDHYVAPAVAADSNYIYFINYNRQRNQSSTKMIRSANPESGKWEICGSVKRIADPCLYIENGRYFVYYGLGNGNPTRCFELDPKTFSEIPGSEIVLKDSIKDVRTHRTGYELGRRELTDEIEAPEWQGKFKKEPSPEGAWIVKNNDTYYLQYATPGTICNWYCDVVMEGKSPTGPFTEMNYNPVSLKVGGFISGAGHSCVFRDKYDNWWQVTTMWVGNLDPFERRLGLFPVTFDANGRMIVHTVLGDYPMRMLQQKFTNTKYFADWWIQSFHKKCEASSSLPNFEPKNASDENIRTWWSAATGNAGEWFSMNFGKKVSINAVQINFGEKDYDSSANKSEDYHAYKLYVSNDGKNWNLLIDKSASKENQAHDYIELNKTVEAAFIKIENVHTAMKGKFSLRDLRVFGNGHSRAPAQVKNVKAVRNKDDERFATVTWKKSNRAEG